MTWYKISPSPSEDTSMVDSGGVWATREATWDDRTVATPEDDVEAPIDEATAWRGDEALVGRGSGDEVLFFPGLPWYESVPRT